MQLFISLQAWPRIWKGFTLSLSPPKLWANNKKICVWNFIKNYVTKQSKKELDLVS